MVNPDIIFGRLSNRLFQMAALYAYCRDNNYPIFVQDEKYFKKYEKEIRELYGTDIKPNSIDRVAIHVRRAKNPINPQEPAYFENPFYENLSHHLHEDIKDNYYTKAMARFYGKLGDGFMIFSDDIEWCKQQKIFQYCFFSEGRSEIEDLNIMASCKSHIIANSSFSWWAAWLGKHDKQIVIAPAKWFADPANEQFIGLPSSWIRI